jgi:hypothetical protein
MALLMQKRAEQGQPPLKFSEILTRLRNTARDLGVGLDLQGVGLLDVGELLYAPE